MIQFITQCAQTISTQVYHSIYGYELKATPENLKWALQQNEKDVLKYKFKCPDATYSILEFAVKCGDCPTVRALAELGADFEFSAAYGGSILHFYMRCLEENVSPNLELLNFLLDKVSDINAKEGYNFSIALECALEEMARYKNIHWSVIETLFQRGAKITENDFLVRTPFMILKDSHFHKIEYGQMIRSFEEEKIFFDHLIKYLELEKKYHADSNCSLTLDEFKFHASHLRLIVSRAVVSMDSSPFDVGPLLDMMEKPDFFAQSEHPLSREELYDFRQLVSSCQSDYSQQLSIKCSELSSTFFIYHKYFQDLVQVGTFKECFETGQLASILPIIKKYPSFETNMLLTLFDLWGLIEEHKARAASMDKLGDKLG